MALSMVLGTSLPALAEIRAQCTGQHALSGQAYKLTVDFLSGGELAKLTKDARYRPTAAYAIVYLGEGKKSIVKLNGSYFSNPVRQNEIRMKKYSGSDSNGVKWSLKPSEFSSDMIAGKAFESYQSQGRGTPVARTRNSSTTLTDKYPNGKTIEKLGVFFYPNGRQVSSTTGMVYPNGQKVILHGRAYYPNGQQMTSHGFSFYPNGQKIGRSSSSDSNSTDYYTESGQKTSSAPRTVEAKGKGFSCTFSTYNGVPNARQFQVKVPYKGKTIHLFIDNGRITQSVLR